MASLRLIAGYPADATTFPVRSAARHRPGVSGCDDVRYGGIRGGQDRRVRRTDRARRRGQPRAGGRRLPRRGPALARHRRAGARQRGHRPGHPRRAVPGRERAHGGRAGLPAHRPRADRARPAPARTTRRPGAGSSGAPRRARRAWRRTAGSSPRCCGAMWTSRPTTTRRSSTRSSSSATTAARPSPTSAILSGSANFTVTDTHRNLNHVVVFHDWRICREYDGRVRAIRAASSGATCTGTCRGRSTSPAFR